MQKLRIFRVNPYLKFNFLLLFFFGSVNLFSETLLKGTVTDAKTGETLPGVAVVVKNTSRRTTSDFDGNFELKLEAGKYNLAFSYMSYSTVELTDVDLKDNQATILNIPMEESAQALKEVTVISMRRLNSEVAMLNTMRNSNSVVSVVSAQQISRNQDTNASEVIKRVPGISIIDDRFIVTRGLVQRYNNVWINNGAVPSSESDTRSFSFDLIPGSQIENIIVVKSPQPELPADFSGGFVKLATKSVPSENSMEVSYGTGINTSTHFQDFKSAKGSGTDFLGFDNGMRGLNSIVPERMDNNNTVQVTQITQNGFNNDWSIKTKKNLLPDQRFSFAINRRHQTENNRLLGLTAALNYSYITRTYTDMENSRFGIYDNINDMPVYTNKYTDNQYNTDVRVGAIANFVFVANDKNKFEFRNMLNQLARDRYTERNGYQFISAPYYQRKYEYIYNSRMTYSGQLAGNHTFSKHNELDWTGGYSYANRRQPDRRIINLEENNNPGDLYNGQYQFEQNEISRDFMTLDEHVYSLTANYRHDIEFASGFKPTVKAGAYGEYKDRDYKNRIFYYRYMERNLPDDFPYGDVINDILIPENYAADKLYIYEDTDNRNSYTGKNTLLAGYLAVNVPLGKLNVYAGLRAEYNKMSLTNYTTIKEYRTKTTDYSDFDLFPSVNATYNINEKHLIRFAYGKSVNRQEFREVSPSVYVDFDLFSSIKGN